MCNSKCAPMYKCTTALFWSDKKNEKFLSQCHRHTTQQSNQAISKNYFKVTPYPQHLLV
jgi:hypothetical protein